MSHTYILDYTLQFARMYSGTNMWVHHHLNAAHEMSGQHAQTLDLDLTRFLKTILNEFSESHEIVLILGADHGMRYGDYRRDI